uniref:Intermediate filament protein ifc-1 n=2 Tax=Anthurium amnicola TaxID=1678845 RepID=A0A1D1YPL5_9ARAE
MVTGAARRRPTVVIGMLVLSMLAAVSVIYLRLWAIDSGFSSEDRDSLRKQFDRANMEAMDESAEWRMKYDREVESVRQYKEEVIQVNEALTTANEKLALLQKENTYLRGQLVSLKHEIKAVRHNCTCDA